MAKARERVDIERMVTWALLDQGLGWSTGQASGAGAMALGTRICNSRIGAPSISLQSDDDALVVRDVIMMLPDDAAELVVRHGRIGTRPDWCPEGVGAHQQRRNKRGQLMWVWEKPGNRRSARLPLMEWVGLRPEQVNYWRASYRMWWHALEAIVPEINARATNHMATGPKALLEPWLGPERVIHTPDGALEARRKEPQNAGIERVFVLRGGRFERYDGARHGAPFEASG